MPWLRARVIGTAIGTHRLKTAEGGLEYSAPQVTGLEQPFRSALREHLKGHTEALESLAVERLARSVGA